MSNDRHQQKGLWIPLQTLLYAISPISDKVCNQQVRSQPGYELGLSWHVEGGREGHEAPFRAACQEDMQGKALPLNSLIYSAAFQFNETISARA